MAIQLPKLSAALLEREAARIRQQKKESGGTGDHRYFNFETGSNRIRPLPISTKGTDAIATIIYRHWKLPGEREKEVCISSSFPNCGAECPIDPVLAKHAKAGTDIGLYRANGKAIINVLDRKNEGKLAQICELPMSVYNWLIASIIEEGMIETFYDLRKGVDLIVVKSISGDKSNPRTEYKASWSPKGPSPIAADPKQVRLILESCYEIDEIYKPFDPDTDVGKKTMMRLRATANALDRRLNDRSGLPEEAEPSDDESYIYDADAEEQQVEEEEQPAEEVAEEQTEETVEEDENAITANPNDQLPCFGHSHIDTSVEYDDVVGGYNPGEYRCVMCPEQAACASEVLRKFPTHYTEDGSEIIPADEIKPAKRTPPPAPKKAAAPPPPPARKPVAAPVRKPAPVPAKKAAPVPAKKAVPVKGRR